MTNGTVARATARMLERRYVTRSGVTRISILIAAAAAVWFSRADLAGAVLGSLLLGLVLYCDVVRSHMRVHRLDALTLWTVSMAVQLREYVVYVGLVFGAAAAGHAGAWGWASGALIALALRDALLVARSSPPARSPVRPFPLPLQRRSGESMETRVPRSRAGDGGGPKTKTASLRTEAPGVVHRRIDTSGPARSVRRMLTFGQPIRFLVIAVTTMVWDARLAFVGLIVGCVLAITHELADPASQGEGR
ncbi:hypothetical protein [Nocardiopsis alkaliphila]|uniref:hypothetical protein n=1 Tax=Nocardiopsis alkaliphila TaxID=225762 RepID=UPI00034C0784|nr:hypothetical protein [Nocardiopsis alkaliphila]